MSSLLKTHNQNVITNFRKKINLPNSLQPPSHISQLFSLMIIVSHHPFGKLKVVVLIVVVPERFLFWLHVLLHSFGVR